MKQVNYLCRADTDWFFQDDPGYTLQQGGRGQGAIIGPIIQRTRKKNLWIKACKRGLLSLERWRRRKTTITYCKQRHCTCFSLDVQSRAVTSSDFHTRITVALRVCSVIYYNIYLYLYKCERNNNASVKFNSTILIYMCKEMERKSVTLTVQKSSKKINYT